MSDSSSSGKFARETLRSRAATGAAAPEEWPATRAEPASQEEIDEWQATRIQARQPSGIDEWRVPQHPPQRHAAGSGAPRRPLRRRAESPDAWAATRAQTALATQLLEDESDYLATEKEEIGRQIGGNERELFVSCAPAEALQQQFEHLQPEFIAVHDIATSSSRKLLTGIAAASGRAVQKLVIRRQGYGTRWRRSSSSSCRPPTTSCCASTPPRPTPTPRRAMRSPASLLAYSRLGVVMVGELPGHAIASALKPLHDDIITGPWPNRNLLLLPLASASTLVTHGLDLGRGTGVAVRTTPQVARPADAWALHHRHLEPPARADARRRPRRPRARRVQGGRLPAASARRWPTGLPSGDTLPMDDSRPPIVLTMRPMPAIATPSLLADDALDADRALRQAAERAERRHQLLRLRGRRAATPIAHAGANPGSVGARGARQRAASPR